MDFLLSSLVIANRNNSWRFAMASSIGAGLGRVVCLALLLGLVGCGKMVTVNAYLDPARSQGLFPGATFAVLPQARTGNPLLEREVADKIGLVLTNSMYRLAPPQAAEYLLTYSFGSDISQHNEMKAIHEPGRKVNVVTTDRDGRKQTTVVEEEGRTRYVPQLVTSHAYSLRLVVYLNREQGQIRRDLAVWSADVTASDREEGYYSQGDLRDALNYLIVGGVSVLGQAGGQPVSFLVKDDDPRLALIRRR